MTTQVRDIVVVRRGATIADLEGMLRVEHESWSEEQAFTREHFLSHLAVFPEGIFLAEVNDEIAGVGISEILDYDLSHPILTWYEATDNGYLKNSHNPDGSYLYGVSLSISPNFSAFRLGSKMLENAKNHIIDKGLRAFIIGSRVPRYTEHAGKMSINDYINFRKGQHYLDPELEFYSKCGFKIVEALPNYFEDPESQNYGVLMIWRNPQFLRKAA